MDEQNNNNIPTEIENETSGSASAYSNSSEEIPNFTGESEEIPPNYNRDSMGGIPPYQGAPGGSEKILDDSTGFGIASLCFGAAALVFFCCCAPVFGIVSLVFGVLQVTKSTKKGMAIAGIVMSSVSIVIFLIFWVIAVTSPVFVNEVRTQQEEIYDLDFFNDDFF